VTYVEGYTHLVTSGALKVIKAMHDEHSRTYLMKEWLMRQGADKFTYSEYKTKVDKLVHHMHNLRLLLDHVLGLKSGHVEENNHLSHLTDAVKYVDHGSLFERRLYTNITDEEFDSFMSSSTPPPMEYYVEDVEITDLIKQLSVDCHSLDDFIKTLNIK